MWKGIRLDKADRPLIGPDNKPLSVKPLSVLGRAEADLRHRDKIIIGKVYIVEQLKVPLLGLHACEELNLVKRMDTTEICENERNQSIRAQRRQRQTSKEDIKPEEEYPKLFTGLGKIDRPYKIRLKEGVRGFALSTPRRVPLPLMDKVKRKLEEMVKEGIIEKVEEPTEWCASMVIAPKPNGDIRLCVDLTKLNRYVRELLPMPVVEHTLGQFAGAKIFSKLDTNSGFYQITLTEESKKLITFITSFGRYMFTRMSIGISSAPEVYQARISQILEGIPGVVVYIDDICVTGKTREEHTKRLKLVLKKLQDAGVTI